MAVTFSQRARRWLAGAAKALEFPIVRHMFYNMWYGASFTEYTYDRLSHEGYRINAAVNICVQKLTTSYQQAPILVKDSGGNVTSNPDESPMLALLQKPNELMSWHELAKYIEIYKAIGGVCRLHKVRDDRNGKILELWPYHIGQIAAVPSEYRWIDHYQFIGDGGDLDDPDNRIDRSDIIDIGWPSVDPKAPWQPLPPLMAIAREVDSDSEATRYMYALLVNDAVPLTVLKLKKRLTQQQFKQLSDQFNQRHGGANRGRIAILEEDGSIERMGLNLEEMAFEAMRYVPEARIAAGFGVPAMYSGLNVGLKQSTYNNMSEARTAFFEDTIVPQSFLDDGELTQSLSNEFPGSLSVARDWRSVPALQENMDAVYKRELDAFKATTTTRNEARRRLGLVPVEEIVLPPGVPPYPPGYGQAFYTAPSPTIPAELLPPTKALADHQLNGNGHAPAIDRALAIKALQHKATTSAERRIERAVRQYLIEEYTKAADGIEESA